MGPWSREDISYCKCTDLSYSHSHCPCDSCDGKAVSRATEYRHWKDAMTSAMHADQGDTDGDSTGNGGDGGDSTDRNRDGGGTSGSDGNRDGGNDENGGGGGDSADGNDGENRNEGDDGVGNNGSGIGDGGNDDNGDGDDGGRSNNDMVKNDVIKAVIKAFQLNDDINGSQQNLLRIVEYGKELYCKGDSTLKELWPNTWQGCVRLLEHNGYKGPKNMFVCLKLMMIILVDILL